MRRLQRWLCASLAGLMLFFGGPDIGGGAKSAGIFISPVIEPTKAPKKKATQAPTAEPTQKPTKATPAPTGEPAAESSEAPAGEETPEPTGKPTQEPTEEPDAIAVTAAAPEGVQVQGKTYTASEEKPVSLTFSWSDPGDCEAYRIRLARGKRSTVYEGTLPAEVHEQQIDGLSEGSYTFTVEALDGDSAVAKGTFSFSVAYGKGEGEAGGDSPEQPSQGKSSGGAKPSGGARAAGGGKSAGTGAEGETEQGFKVTPGTALTSAHVSGDRSMTLYGALALSLPDAPMTKLTLDDTPLEIVLDGGTSAFTAQIDGDRLTLTPETAGDTWSVNGLAARTLRNSGIALLALRVGSGTVEFATEQVLGGEIYSRLCMEGYVSADYEYRVSEGGTSVSVAGKDYTLGADRALVPTEG